MGKILLSLFFLIFINYSAEANMALGGWIESAHISGNKYQVKLFVYSNCVYGDLPSPKVEVSSVNRLNVISELFFESGNTETYVHQYDDPGVCLSKSCDTSLDYSIKLNCYIDTVDLSNTLGCSIFLIYNGPSYTSDVKNIQPGYSLYLETFFFRCNNFINNSTPKQFINHNIFLSRDYPHYSSYASFDESGEDSIAYVKSGLKNSSGNIPYSSSYTKESFIGFLGFPNFNFKYPGGLNFDLLGNLSFTPAIGLNYGPYLFSYEVIEFSQINNTAVEISRGNRVIPLIVLNKKRLNKVEPKFIKNQVNICDTVNTPYYFEFDFNPAYKPKVNVFSLVRIESIEVDTGITGNWMLKIKFDSLSRNQLKKFSNIIIQIEDTSQNSIDSCFKSYSKFSFNFPLRDIKPDYYKRYFKLDTICNNVEFAVIPYENEDVLTWKLYLDSQQINSLIQNSADTLHELLTNSGNYFLHSEVLANGCIINWDSSFNLSSSRPKLVNKEYILCNKDSSEIEFEILNPENNSNYWLNIFKDSIPVNNLIYPIDSVGFHPFKLFVKNSIGCIDSIQSYYFKSDIKFTNLSDSIILCGDSIVKVPFNGQSSQGLTYDLSSINDLELIDSHYYYKLKSNYEILPIKIREFNYCDFIDSIYFLNLGDKNIFINDLDTSFCNRDNSGFFDLESIVQNPDSITNYYINNIQQKIFSYYEDTFLIKVKHKSGCEKSINYIIDLRGSNHEKNEDTLKLCSSISGKFLANEINPVIDTFGLINKGIDYPKALKVEANNLGTGQIYFYTNYESCLLIDTIQVIPFNFNAKINVKEHQCESDGLQLLAVDSGLIGGVFYLNGLLTDHLIYSGMPVTNTLEYRIRTTDSLFCSTYFPLTVHKEPIPLLFTDKVSGSAPLNIKFNNVSINYDQFRWEISTGFSDSLNDSFSYVFNQPGLYSVKLFAKNKGCDWAVDDRPDFIKVQGFVSTEPYEDSNFSIYPNPAREIIYCKSKTFPIAEINVYDVLGKKLINVKPNNMNYELELPKLNPNQIIFIEIITPEGYSNSFKILIKN